MRNVHVMLCVMSISIVLNVRIFINPLMKFVRKHINNHVYCSRSKYTDNNVRSQYKQMYVTLAGKIIIYVCKRCKRSTDKDYKL